MNATAKTVSASLGRPRLPKALAATLMALSPRLRGQVVATILVAHATGMDLRALSAASADLRRLGILVNQSLRLSHGTSTDTAALAAAAKKINSLWP